MLEVSKFFPGYQFIIAEAPSVEDEFYQKFYKSIFKCQCRKKSNIQFVITGKCSVGYLGNSYIGNALFGVPEVVCYKGSTISYQIAKRVIKVKYISMVNLIMDRLVVKELIQNDLTVENLEHELHELLTNEKGLQK
jgi:lipid-A-disaccharide synthase